MESPHNTDDLLNDFRDLELVGPAPEEMVPEESTSSESAPGEEVERGLDRLVHSRDKERRRTEGDRAREFLWADSARRYAKQREHERLIEELRFCEGQLRRHSRTSALFREKYTNRIRVLADLLEIGPIGQKRKKAS